VGKHLNLAVKSCGMNFLKRNPILLSVPGSGFVVILAAIAIADGQIRRPLIRLAHPRMVHAERDEVESTFQL
jgi:hypothetical protein